MTKNKKPAIDIYREIPKRLKTARLKRGFETAKAFATKNGVAASTYCQHETGKRQMSLRVIAYYAQALDIDIQWLIQGKGVSSSEQ